MVIMIKNQVTCVINFYFPTFRVRSSNKGMSSCTLMNLKSGYLPTTARSENSVATRFQFPTDSCDFKLENSTKLKAMGIALLC